MDASATRTLLRLLLTGPMGEQSTQHALKEIALRDPVAFFDICLSILESLPDDSQRSRAYARSLECQEFLKELIRIGRYSNQELTAVCAEWIKVDGLLDVRMARLAPGRDEDEVKLPPELVARVLDVLHEISTGSRLIVLVNHLKSHPNADVAERATRLVGRRIRNLGWVKQRLESTDAGIRAAAVEGLWGSDMPSARMLMRRSRHDDDSRVVANAILGLHFLGEKGVGQWVIEMARDERTAFRRCAVWVMGRIGSPEFQESLHAALADSEAAVRLGAKQALAAIRRLTPEAVPVTVAVSPVAVSPVAVPPTAPPPAKVEAEPATETETDPLKLWRALFGFRFDGTLNAENR